MSPEWTANIIWFVWYATWIAAVLWSAKTRVQLGTDMMGMSRLFFSLGLVLLFIPSVAGVSRAPFAATFMQPLWHAPDAAKWALVGLIVLAFAFCWWARLHLGRLWSGFVTLKEGHHIVDTGPYGIVRHPIYSGIIFAALMTALLKATPMALAGFALTFLGLWMIARVEERFLREQLGADAYNAYKSRVGMLAPKMG
jgi:protein-S-isoprenylcysteine O-methyltransferase Ste14